MSDLYFRSKKWTVRALVAIGTLLGLSSCNKTIYDPKTIEGVYGPPPGQYERLEPVKVVYGPPPRVILYDNGPKVPSQISGEPIYDEPAKAKKAKKSKSTKKVKKSKKVKKNKK